MNNENKVLKAAIIGYGYMGEIRKKVVERSPNLELAGIYESSPAIRERIQDSPLFDSFESLLDSNVDVVFVCTPNAHSPHYCVESLKRGKHVFCEKPPGRNVDDILAIMNAESASPGAKLMFGFNHRFHPGVLKAKVLVENGSLGKIIGLRGIYGKSGGVNFSKSWRNDKGVSGGGILLDQGIHMLDLFRFFCGDFDAVKCFVSNSFWKFDIEDNAVVILQNKGQQTATLHSSSTFWKHAFQLDIMLENGYLVIEGLLSKTGSYGREKLIVGKRQFEDQASALGNPAEEINYFDRDLSWDLEVEEFVRCVLEDRRVGCSSSQDALRAMEIIQQAYEDASVSLAQETLK